MIGKNFKQPNVSSVINKHYFSLTMKLDPLASYSFVKCSLNRSKYDRILLLLTKIKLLMESNCTATKR